MGSVSQTPVVSIARVTDSVAAGAPMQFVVRAAPAPPADLAVGVRITSSGCALIDAPETVTIAAGTSQATLTVPTTGARVGEAGCEVTAALAEGGGYRTGGAAAVSASATLTPEQPEQPEQPVQPVVTVEASASTVTEGGEVSFMLTATPAPVSDLTVTVSWSEQGSFLPASRPETFTIPTTGTAALSLTIPDDSAEESDGSVTVTVAAGSGYTVGSQSTATVAVTDNDRAAPVGAPPSPPPSRPVPHVPRSDVSILADRSQVVEGATISFTLTAAPTPPSDLVVTLKWFVQRPVVNPLPGEPQVTSSDWPGTPRQVTISASSGTTSFSVTAPDDSTKQTGTGKMYVGGVVMPGTGYERHPATGVRTLTLIDND